MRVLTGTIPPWVGKLLSSLAIAAAVVLLAIGSKRVGVADTGVMLILLVAVVLCAWLFGLFYSALVTFLVILAHSYFFSSPLNSFAVENPQDLVPFVVMIAIGWLVGTLAKRLQTQIAAVRAREQRLEILNRFGNELASRLTSAEVVESSERFLREVLQTEVGFWLPGDEKTQPDLVRQVLLNKQKAGRNTAVLGESEWFALPLHGSSGVTGIVLIGALAKPEHEKLSILDALSPTISLALERVSLFEKNQENALRVESEKMRNVLLQGISHDLRTPLTVIAASSSSLLSAKDAVFNSEQRLSIETIRQEADGLVYQVNNALNMMRLDSEGLETQKDWIPAEDIAQACVERLANTHPERKIELSLPEEITLCWCDESLIEQAIMNLLLNAVEYSPGNEPIELDARLIATGRDLRFSVRDRGPGVPDNEKKRIFDKFERGSTAKRVKGYRGSGLGLAIVETVARLHQGKAGVADRDGGGSEFWIELPVPEDVPHLSMDTK